MGREGDRQAEREIARESARESQREPERETGCRHEHGSGGWPARAGVHYISSLVRVKWRTSNALKQGALQIYIFTIPICVTYLTPQNMSCLFSMAIAYQASLSRGWSQGYSCRRRKCTCSLERSVVQDTTGTVYSKVILPVEGNVQYGPFCPALD